MRHTTCDVCGMEISGVDVVVDVPNSKKVTLPRAFREDSSGRVVDICYGCLFNTLKQGRQ